MTVTELVARVLLTSHSDASSQPSVRARCGASLTSDRARANGAAVLAWRPRRSRNPDSRRHRHRTIRLMVDLRLAGSVVVNDDQGMDGEFVGVYETARGTECASAVLLVGGSEGGLLSEHVGIATALADRGVAALSIAYFGLPDLPPHLAGIRLEYFADALGWLAQRTGLGAGSLVMWGASRGSEAALLSAVHFPDLVHNVIALVPGNVVLAGWPGRSGPAWTLEGVPLPFTHRFGPDAMDERALIPVEQVVGDVFLAGAGADMTWPSADMAIAMRARRGDARPGDMLINYPDAGHDLALVTPGGNPTLSQDPTTQARLNLWFEIVHFLESVARKH